MKVLVVGPDMNDPGGVANYYKSVFPRLSCDDIEVHYLEVGSTHGRESRFHFLTDQQRFRDAMATYDPDIVHLNPSLVIKSFIRDGLFLYYAKKQRASVLVFFRGWQVSFERYVSSVLRWYFNLTYRRADMFIVLSSSFSRRLTNWGIKVPIHLGNTVVADEILENFDLDQKARDIETSDEIKLLFLARLEKEKGVLEVLYAVINLIDKGFDVALTIAGDGPVIEDLRGIVSKKPEYRKRISIAGYVKGQDKVEIYEKHHIFCFPSLYAEGMPNSIMEAMGFAMPVITCPVGGIADFFEDNVMGVLIQNRTIDAIANAIEILSVDRAKLAKMARYNHEYANKRFLASTSAEVLRDHYRELVDVS